MRGSRRKGINKYQNKTPLIWDLLPRCYHSTSSSLFIIDCVWCVFTLWKIVSPPWFCDFLHSKTFHPRWLEVREQSEPTLQQETFIGAFFIFLNAVKMVSGERSTWMESKGIKCRGDGGMWMGFFLWFQQVFGVESED